MAADTHASDLFASREFAVARIETLRRELRRAEADYCAERPWLIAKGRKLAALEAAQSSMVGAVDALAVLDGEIHWALNAEATR